MAYSSQGAKASTSIGHERHRQARELADHVVTGARQRVDAGPPEGALLVRIRAGPSGVLDDHDQIREAGELRGRHSKLIGMGHQLEDQVPLLQRAEHAGVGDRSHVGAHRADPAET